MAYPPVTCFWLECTKQVDRRLRRYSGSLREEEAKCPGYTTYHDATIKFDVIDELITPDYAFFEVPHDDPRWPAKCDHCPYIFVPTDEFRLYCNHLWKRADTGELTTLRDAPPGAMYNADWLTDFAGRHTGPDGRSLHVKLPNGRTWHIDGQASNCDQRERPHKCWVRHGEPPRITVDKAGDTCNAGAGSIQAGDYHGMLTDGVLRE